jgi:hypothetical protein
LSYRRQEVSVVNSEKVYTEGTGDVMIKLNYKNSNAITKMKCILYVPGLVTNLSVSKMVEKGFVVTFVQQGCRVYDEDDCTVQGEVQVTGQI